MMSVMNMREPLYAQAMLKLWDVSNKRRIGQAGRHNADIGLRSRGRGELQNDVARHPVRFERAGWERQWAFAIGAMAQHHAKR